MVPPAGDPVALVDRADDRDLDPRRFQQAGDEAIAGTDALLTVDDQQGHVGLGQLAFDPGLHPFGQRVAGALHAGQVDQDQLAFGLEVGGDAADRAAGRLRAHRDDRDVAADEGVDQGRLADVGAAGEADETRPRAHRSDART